MIATGLIILFVSLAVGIPVLIAAILLLVFRLIRRATARARAELNLEGVVLESGRLWITIRYKGYRAPGFYRGGGVTKTRTYLVLTRKRLTLLMPGSQSNQRLFWRGYAIARGDLGRFTVGVAEDGALHIHSDDPPYAKGSIDYRIAVGNAAAWVKALTEAGARLHAG